MSISIPPIPEPVAEAYAKIMSRSGNRTDICDKCVHQDGCKDREAFHTNHYGCYITFCSGYERQQTNSDRIRAMSDEELAEWIANWETRCYKRVDPLVDCDTKNFAKQILDWLKSPAEEGEG